MILAEVAHDGVDLSRIETRGRQIEKPAQLNGMSALGHKQTSRRHVGQVRFTPQSGLHSSKRTSLLKADMASCPEMSASARAAQGRGVQTDTHMSKLIGRYRALLPLFRLVGVPCIATLWRVESLMRHRSDRPKLANRSHLTLRFTADVFPRFSSISY